MPYDTAVKQACDLFDIQVGNVPEYLSGVFGKFGCGQAN